MFKSIIKDIKLAQAAKAQRTEWAAFMVEARKNSETCPCCIAARAAGIKN